MTVNMTATIAPKSDQLNSDDLIGGPRTVTITRVSGNESNVEQPVNVWFDGDGGKPYRPCKSMRRVMVAIWGADASAYVGRSMTLYRDPSVTWGGMQVGGIRISHMSHIDKPQTMALTATQKQRKPYTVQPLTDAPKLAPPVDVAATVLAAHTAAERGTEAFRAWWAAASKEERAAVNHERAQFQATAARADLNAKDDPFTAPSSDDIPTDDAAAEAELQSRYGTGA